MGTYDFYGIFICLLFLFLLLWDVLDWEKVIPIYGGVGNDFFFFLNHHGLTIFWFPIAMLYDDQPHAAKSILKRNKSEVD